MKNKKSIYCMCTYRKYMFCTGGRICCSKCLKPWDGQIVIALFKVIPTGVGKKNKL